MALAILLLVVQRVYARSARRPEKEERADDEHKNNNDDLEAVVLTEQPARDIETADRQLFHASLDSLLTDFKSHMERIDIMEPSYERAGWRTAIIPT